MKNDMNKNQKKQKMELTFRALGYLASEPGARTIEYSKTSKKGAKDLDELQGYMEVPKSPKQECSISFA